MVLDAAACLDLLLQTPTGAALREPVAAASALVAPEVQSAEVLRVLRRIERTEPDSAVRVAIARLAYGAIDMTAMPHAPLLDRAWDLRFNVAPEDALYVALAELTGLPLLTTDHRLARAVRDHTSVRVLTDRDVS